jgi:putative oxidoreductase
MTTAPAQSPSRSKAPLLAFYDQFARVADKFRCPFLLLIRIYIGYQCIISGWAHLHHIHETAKFFASLHIPMPEVNVIMSANAEIFCGALLLVGLASRLAALVLTGNFIVAMLTVQLSNYNSSFKDLGAAIWKDQSPILSDTAFPFLATAIIVLLFGPGNLSVDGIIRYFRKK